MVIVLGALSCAIATVMGSKLDPRRPGKLALPSEENQLPKDAHNATFRDDIKVIKTALHDTI
ncbi:hypothetical protein [Azorhizobium sp. AG788]|uniref:hypothetical protein n=1 Tax=Azorhizobium sp. AG788 TaxID=2183897 RepID=UPI003139FBEC